MVTHSSILAREIPWTEEPDGLQCMGSHRVGHGWEHARTHTHTHTHTQTNTLRINVFTSYHALLQAHWVLLCLWSWCLTPRMSCPCFSTCWAHFWSLIFGLHSLYLPLDPSNHVELINSSSLSSWYYVPLRSIAVITLSKKKKSIWLPSWLPFSGARILVLTVLYTSRAFWAPGRHSITVNMNWHFVPKVFL